MAFYLRGNVGGVTEAAAYEFTSSGTVALGSVVVFDTVNTGRVGVTTTASDANVQEIFGVAVSAGTDGGQVKVVPIVPGQLWEADCANNSSTTQIGNRCILTDQTQIANTVEDIDSTAGVFLLYGIVGAAADKKAIGTFLKAPFAGWSIT